MTSLISKLVVVHLSLDFWLGCGHTSNDPRPKQETDQRPGPTSGSGMGPGHLLALEVDRWNLDGSRETRITKYIVPESFLLKQGDFSCTVRESAFCFEVEVVDRTTAEMSDRSSDSKNLGIMRFQRFL